MAAESVTGPVPRGWDLLALGEIVSKSEGGSIQTGPFGSQLHASDYVPDGVPTIMPVNIGDNKIIEAGIQRITEADANRLSKHRVLPGDIIYSRRGDVERRALIREHERGWFCGTGCLKVRLGRGSLDPLFTAYYLGHPDVRAWIVRHAVGATMPNLNTEIMSAIPMLGPPLPEQRAIAGVLGALDDKIEVNRKTARVLEGIARAVFTSWFVDFDPVRRHSRAPHAAASHPGSAAVRRAPGPAPLPADLAALFPTRLVDSPIGEVPEGWRVGTIDSLCDSITSGGTPARMNKQYWEGGTIPWFKTGELFDAPLFDSEEHITEAALANSSCKLWPAGTILFALYASPTVGRMGVLTRAGTSNQAAAGLTVKPEYGIPFLLNTLFFARAKLQQIAVGAAQQNINQGVLKAHQVVVPAAGLAQRFSQLMTPALEKQAQLSSHSATLAALRDALLPKLISGELRIADAEKIVGMVV